jgi:hypothetical protein
VRATYSPPRNSPLVSCIIHTSHAQRRTAWTRNW